MPQPATTGPRFAPFRALRYAPDADLAAVIAPPYDVLSRTQRDAYAARDPHNIVHADLPRADHGAQAGERPEDYAYAASLLRTWLAEGVLVADEAPTLTIYRMRFTDTTGAARDIAGVLGALEVVDEGAGGVLPHERTTPKDSNDRLELTRATSANLSPVWGLSLAPLAEVLAEPGEPVGTLTVDGVEHAVERVSDPQRIAQICSAVASDDVLIADGHHRYGVARRYRDEVRASTGRTDTPAELTLAFVNELSPEQLSVAAIHRLLGDGTALEPEVLTRLGRHFDIDSVTEQVSDEMVLSSMDELGRLVLITRNASQDDMAVGPADAEQGAGVTQHWLVPRPGAFDDVRALDGAWLEHALPETAFTYQHGVAEVRAAVAEGRASAGILIRPVSVEEIERTAREGLLMPPKSTFFTPKLRTGFVIRPLDGQ